MSDLQELIHTNAHNAFAIGVRTEQERILTLLQGQKVSLCKCDNCNTVVHLIDLIKGQQND
jgi:hypothetical protein